MDARAFEYTAQEYCDDLKVAPKNQKFEFMAETKSNSPVLFSGKDFPCAFLYKHDVLRNKKHKSYFMKTGSYENTQNKRGTLAG